MNCFLVFLVVVLALEGITTKDNISEKQKQALHYLKEDKEITILPADNGRATVILNKEDYIKKCDEHRDSGPYM